MAVLIGLEAEIYIVDLANAELPITTWPATGLPPNIVAGDLTPVTSATDVTLNMSKTEADISSRGSKGWRQRKGTLKEGELSFDMNWDTEDASFEFIQAGWRDGTGVAVLALDRRILDDAGDLLTAPTDKAEGLFADMAVLDFEKSEPLEEAQTVSVSMSVSDIDRIIPLWAEYVGVGP